MDKPHDLKISRESLEAEFCPPLDTSLFAALYSDADTTPEGIAALRDTLNRLAAEAVVEGAAVELIPSTTTNYREDRSSNSDLPSAISSISFSTESSLTFLRAAFPDLPVKLLQNAIDNGFTGSSINMESLVEELLSIELLETLEQDLSIEGEVSTTKPEEWQTATSSKKRAKRKIKPEGDKILMGDIRQRQLSKSSPDDKGRQDVLDPWTQLTSLANYLSTIFPSTPSSTFLSAFHSPAHSTPFHALTAYINSHNNSDKTEEETDASLITVVEVMSSNNHSEEIDASWARKCVQATTCLEDAIDLYLLLKELETFVPISHAPPPTTSSTSTHTIISSPTTRPPSAAVQTLSGPRPSKSKTTPSTRPTFVEWQVVEARKPKPRQLHPLAEYIPAYSNLKAVPAWTLPKQAVDDVSNNRAIEQDWRERRVEALRKASQHWQKSQDGFGRQVAGYYAEEANKYLRESREAAFKAARALVITNKVKNASMGYDTRNTVDLHGMTREEALVIAREALTTRAASPDANQRDEPLRFIMGKGRHSVGHASVLLPSLQKALRKEGWRVREVEAGIVVYGKV